MLKLEKMELIGFKSFSGRTEVSFPNGITAVVGPNGCGKSNIGDAISWVLGEQSAKSLRGDKMEDVIFNGSERLKPMGMAEVSLKFVLDNRSSSDGREEIVLTRRLFRSGESEYILNGQRCRLKDISDLLSRRHIGAKTCAVIEQGRVEEIMNSRPIERRLIIEEAAGIIGYKGKRRVAESKLEATKANLLRIQDIIRELEKQMRSLKRQVSRARRFSTLREALREKQAILFSRKNQILMAKLSELKGSLNELREKESEILDQREDLEEGLERGKEELSQAEEDLAKAVEAIHLLDKKVHQEESCTKNATEKIKEIESSMAKIGEKRQRLQMTILEIEKNISEKKKEKADAEKEMKQLKMQIEKNEQDLNALKEKEEFINKSLEEGRELLLKEAGILSEIRNAMRIHEIEKKKLESACAKKQEEEEMEKRKIKHWEESLSQMRENRKKNEQECMDLESELASLQKEEERLKKSLIEEEQNLSRLKIFLSSLYEKENIYRGSEISDGVIDGGIEAILKGRVPFERDHSGLVINQVKAEEKYAKAVEGYLGELLPALCVQSVHDAVHGLKIIKERKAGSGRFLFCEAADQKEQKMDIPESIRQHTGFMGRLSERVNVTDGLERVLQPVLQRCLLVENLDTALLFYQSCPSFNYVTPDGEVIRSQECLAILPSAENGQKAMRCLKGKLESLKREIEDVRKNLNRREEEWKERKEQLCRIIEKEKGVREKIGKMEKVLLSLSHDEKRFIEQLAYAKKKVFLLQEELSLIDGERKDIIHLLEKDKNIVTAQENEFSKRDQDVHRWKRERDHIEEQLSSKSKALSELYSEYRVPGERIASLEAELVHLARNLEEMKKRVEELRAEESFSKERIKDLMTLEENSRTAMEEMILKKDRMEERLDRLRREILFRKESLASMEDGLKEIRSKLDGLRTLIREKELEKTGIERDIRHNAEACYEDLARGIEDLHSEREAHAELDEEVLAREISELKEKIQGIGPINMMAIEEYEDLEKRFQFLSHQEKDLTDSMNSLTETIRKINRTSREKFREAFQEIRGGFNEIFQTLFNGGRADLRLEEGIDVLESGVEIIAQPPGKKLQNMSLLSGGEKALTAIALLFSVFRYRPSPFCLLDEVDSALDDINIEKFIHMLKGLSEKTQFILITHNKKTMEIANLLYGVTMEEPGISKIVSLKLS